MKNEESAWCLVLGFENPEPGTRNPEPVSSFFILLWFFLMRWNGLLLICAFVIGLLSPDKTVAQIYRFTSYTASMGLPGNTIYCLYQDRQGYMWFGTDSGACRYDGANFTSFGVQQGLADSSVRTIFEDRKGRLWFCTMRGLSCFEQGKFTNYTTAQGLVDDHVYSGLEAPDGSLWLGTAAGLSHFDGQRFVHFGKEAGLPNWPVWSLAQDSAGIIWFVTRGGGAGKFDGTRATVFTLADGLPGESAFDVDIDPAGGVWFATNGGPCFFDGAKFRTYTTKDGLNSPQAGKILIDRYHRIWCAMFGGGINRLDPDGVKIFDRTHGIPNDLLTAVLEDYEGNLWFGTQSNGAFRFSSELFASYTAAHGLGDGRISGIAETPDEQVWIATATNGLFALNPKTGAARHFGTKDGLLEETLWSLFADSRHRIWVGGYKGVTCLDGQNIETFTREQMGLRERVTAITEDQQGRLWFGSYPTTSNGIAIYDNQKFSLMTTQQGLLQNPINTLTRGPDGSIWVSCDKGLSHFDGQQFSHFRIGQGLPGNRVQCAYFDSTGTLWVGTDGGISRLTGTTFTSFTTTDGLPSNSIRAIVGGDKTLWIGTTRGISAYDGQTFRNYSTKDGLASDDVGFGLAIRRRDGTIWFGTGEGVVRYRAALDIARAITPRLGLAPVLVEEKPVQLVSGATGNAFQLPVLSYQQNDISFEFLCLSFTDETAIRYSYQLEGLDHNWSVETANRIARYANLTPGDYRFRVKARAASGVWSEVSTIEFAIKPPFWKTWWFQLAGIFLVSSSIYGGYMLRIRGLRLREEQRIAHLQQLQEQKLEHLRQLQQQRVEYLSQIHEQRLEGMRQLLESIRLINSKLDLTIVLQNIVEESARLVGGEPGGIGLLEGDEIRFHRLWAADHWEDSLLTFKIGEGVAGRVAESKQTMIVDDPHHSPYITQPETLDVYHVEGMMEVPIVSRDGQVVGVLDIRHRAGSPPFNDNDRQLVESLANQAAVALENAALYGVVEEKKNELEAKNLVIVESMNELEKLYKQEHEFAGKLKELDQMKTNFMIVTSHEMRTPLTVLRGYCEALLDEYLGPLTEAQRVSLTTCHRMVDRLTRSFNDILEMVKINAGQITLKPKVFHLNAAVNNVLTELHTFIEQRKQQVKLQIPEQISISADCEKIELVLINIIQNAIKFTPDYGEILIAVTTETECIHILVQDSGIGIDAVDLTHIFDKFYTNQDPSTHRSGRFEFSARGTGLGLAIAKSYVEAHNGQIWAESNGVGTGSTFHIVLPIGVRPDTMTSELTDLRNRAEEVGLKKTG